MYCFRCGAKNDDDAKYCTNCNANLTNNYYDASRYNYNINDSNDHDSQYLYSYNYNNDNVLSGDEKYLSYYVGPNYNNIKNSKFSIPSFFFGPLYFIYRKLYLYGFLWLLALVVLSIFEEENLFLGTYLPLISILFNTIIAFKFKDIYFKKANKDIENIKNGNLGFTNTELLRECEKTGNTLSFKIIPIILLIFFIIMLIGQVLFLGTFFMKMKENLTNEETLLDELTYKVTNDYTNVTSTNKLEEYKLLTDNNDCNIKIEVLDNIKGYKDETDFFNNKYTYHPTKPIEHIYINNTPWKKLIVDYNYSPRIDYIYLKFYNNKAYQVTFNINKDLDKRCVHTKDIITESFKFNSLYDIDNV